MTPASKRHWFAFLLGMAFVGPTVVAVWFGWHLVFGYNLNTFKGDGRITDSGFWSYPRYHVVMPTFSLESVSERTFTLEGLPPERMTLSFRLSGRVASTAESAETLEDNIKQSSVVFKCKLSDNTGVTVCEIADPLSNWRLAVSARDMKLWHMRSRDLKISSKRRYFLTVGIESPEPDLTVEPTLAGGGNELP